MTVYDLFSMIGGNGDFSIYTRQYATNNMKYVLLAYGQVNEVSFSTVPYVYCDIAYISVSQNGLNIVLDDKYIFDKNTPQYTYVKSRYFYECELIGLRDNHKAEKTEENSMKEADETEGKIGAIRKIGKRLVIDVIDKDSTVLKSTRLPNFFQYCRAYKID